MFEKAVSDTFDCFIEPFEAVFPSFVLFPFNHPKFSVLALTRCHVVNYVRNVFVSLAGTLWAEADIKEGIFMGEDFLVDL